MDQRRWDWNTATLAMYNHQEAEVGEEPLLEAVWCSLLLKALAELAWG